MNDLQLYAGNVVIATAIIMVTSALIYASMLLFDILLNFIGRLIDFISEIIIVDE